MRQSFHITSGYKVLPGRVGTEAGAALRAFMPSQSAPAHPRTQAPLTTARSPSPARRLCQERRAAPLGDRAALQALQIWSHRCLLLWGTRGLEARAFCSPLSETRR